MTPSILATASGGLIVAGLLCLAAGLTKRRPSVPRPRSRVAVRLREAALRRKLLAAVGVGVLVLLVSRWPIAAIAAAVAVFVVPKVFLANATRRRLDRLDGLEQWTRRLADVLGASRGLEDALMASATFAPPSIGGPVNALARRLRARVSTEEALRHFADEVNDPVGDEVAAGLILGATVRGKGLTDLLTGLAAKVAALVADRREIEAERATYRTVLKWLAGLLIAVFVVYIANPTYAAPFGTLGGQIAMAIIIGLCGTALAWLHRLGAEPPSGRFLDREPT